MNILNWWLIGVYLMIAFSVLQALDLDKCESYALGMESNQILDDQITASTSFDIQSVGPQNGRIRTERASGAWCPKQQIRNNSYEFLQVNLNKNMVFRGVETQGRYGNGTGREFAEKYFIDYWRIGNQWIRYRNRSGHQLIDGNEDTETAVLRILDPPIVASKIRIVPFSSVTRTTCLRMELYGCIYSDGLLAYSTSKVGSPDHSDLLFEETDLQDSSRNKKGLGLLTDGYIAVDSPTSSHGLNASWLGWTQKSTSGEIEILFGFDNSKKFSDLKMFTFGQNPEKVLVDLYENDSIDAKSNQISQSFSSLASDNVTILDISLQGNLAKHVRVTIIFSAAWFYLTEVKFLEAFSCDFTVISSTKSNGLFDHDQYKRFEVYYFVIFFLLAVFVLLLLYFCILYLVKRARSNNKLGTTSARNSFYSKPGILVTTLGGDSTPKQMVQSIHSFLPGSRSQDFLQQQKSGLYATLNEFGGQKQRMIGHRSHAFSYATSLSRSGEESSPSLLEFNFPPPPTSSSTTSEEIVYAEPCVNAPLLPYRLKTSASASLVATNLKSPYRKPVPKPRSFRDFRNRTLPSRATKNLTSKQKCLPENNAAVFDEEMLDRNQLNKIPFLSSSVEIIEKIGEGKFTQIFKSKPEYVTDLAARKALMAETEVMSRLSDNHLFVKFIDRSFNSNTLVRVCTSIAAGMKYLETHQIVHGHLSPRSCLIDDHLNVKIASPRGPNLHAQLRYSAPEAIVLDNWSSKTDVWSFAITCWELLNHCAKLPFSEMSNAQIVDNCQKILEGSRDAVYLDFSIDFANRQIADLLKDSWNADSSLRPAFLEIQLFFMRMNVNSDV
uniref:Discoidin domain-containing receptor 2 n=1 Tax=Ditylenchus dipsaci TaxID=166011 RepID=A0A915CRD0_9BILA